MTADTTGDEPADESSVLGTCSACGNPTTMTVVLGPGNAYVKPCGCRVAPELLVGPDPNSSGTGHE
ncbi:hypothetical protein G6M89_07800 [Natronolimnobius sp. AArcel1]|uniref:hypothetical protein n=1 Tax=Natronolimnobius sp. AArcel1 TaxID=1679093 RepID=UPI0013E9D934|nr:hypothetical protein [Natronolimnobius sp. AArcel1]NGM68914.1 hypothetical protein [Natronolimnobius sp. AArcel1]